MNRTWGILGVAVLALTGCGGPSTQPARTETSPAAETTAAATKTADGMSTCQDDAADSQSVDIDQVRLLSDGSLMFMTFTTAANVPTTGTVLYSVTAWSPDGKTGYQMGAKFQNGKEVANFVFNLVTNKQENITNGATAIDAQVSTRYPLSKLAGLGNSFGWSGTVSVNGTDVDRCPGGETKTLYPNS
jgi:hypothetical protein